jgi:hypothetical protein
MASLVTRAHARADHQNTTSRTPPPRPLPQDVVDRGHRYTIAQRVQCLTLLAEGFSGREVEKRTDVKPSAQSHIKKRARDHGFHSEEDPCILNYYVENRERSDRPKEITLEIEQRLLDSNKADRAD